MVRSCTAHRSHRSPDHDGRFDLAIGHVGNIGGLLDNLSNSFESKIKKSFVDHCARASHGGANRCARGSEFADAGVAETVVAEFFPQSAGLAKVSAARTNALPDIDNAVVSTHLLAQSLNSCISVGDHTALL